MFGGEMFGGENLGGTMFGGKILRCVRAKLSTFRVHNPSHMRPPRGRAMSLQRHTSRVEKGPRDIELP